MLINRLPERAVGRYGLAALIGAAGVLCFAPFGLFWLTPVIWGGLFALLLRAETPRQGLLTGLAFGLGFFLYPALFAIVAMLYFGLTMGGPSQASAGMNVMGLALARVDGRPIDFLTAIVHLVLFWIGNAVLTPFIVLVGLFTDRGRLLHDLLLGTVMVRRDRY